ncbi:hypothetical protein [Synechococcus sp. MIT S1220]|uniref:hypothetical protein n=1 Tax=Synechococcus sp. MIT S1220 TaxID=3082549 RepID=UPI0039B0D50F
MKSIHLFSRCGEQIAKQLNLVPVNYINNSILDCSSGASTLVAYLNRLGINIKGLDPLYKHNIRELMSKVYYDQQILKQKILNEYPDNRLEIEKTFLHASNHHAEFISDYKMNRVNYLFDSYPKLNLNNNSFDSVFTSNYLFTYSSKESGGISEDTNALSYSYHEKSFLELVRVSSSEIKIFPVDKLESPTHELHPYLNRILKKYSNLIKCDLSLSPSFAYNKDKRLLITINLK